MTISGDTDDLLSANVWGEEVEITRNQAGYGRIGTGGDLFTSVSTPNADIQRVSGSNPARDLGQGRFMTHQIFLPNGANVRQGDRIRASDWSVGKAEYFVEAVLADEGHTEVRTRLVRAVQGVLNYLLLEDGTYLYQEDGGGMILES